METPESKLQSSKDLLKSLEDDLYKIESEHISLAQKKEGLLKQIEDTKNKIVLLETVTDQYNELIKSFEAKKNDLLRKIQ
jgi:Mg2+ and Co2+ transporter CorA